VFSEEEGKFGAVFLVSTDEKEQQLKVSVGTPVEEGKQIVINQRSPEDQSSPTGLEIELSEDSEPVIFSYPGTGSDKTLEWKKSEGNSLWFEKNEGDWEHGGRLSPNQTDIDLEYWWQNLIDADKMEEIMASLESATGNKKDLMKRMLAGIERRVDIKEPFFELDLAGTPFEDSNKERTWRLTNSGWEKPGNGKVQGLGVIAVQSSVDDKILCIAWTNASGVTSKNSKVGVSLKAVEFGLNKRYHVRGKLYLIDNNLDALEDRIRKELNL
jgi:hypothetical protein